MNRSSLMTLCAIVLVATLVVTPPVFGCTQCCTVCGPACPQIFYDNYFDQECAWVFAGGTQLVVVDGNSMGELYGVGSIYQEITPGENNDLRFTLTVDVGSDPGTERIAVEVVSSNDALLETLDTLTTGGTYDYYVGDYTSYGTIRIRFRFRRLTPLGAGDTVYRIDNAYFWAY